MKRQLTQQQMTEARNLWGWRGYCASQLARYYGVTRRQMQSVLERGKPTMINIIVPYPLPVPDGLGPVEVTRDDIKHEMRRELGGW